MPALTKDRDTKARSGDNRNIEVAAGVEIFAGALVAYNAAGHAVPGSTSTTLKAAGRASSHVDNTSGASGDKSIEAETGIFAFANSSAADEITRGDIGDVCYIVDDQTVAKTDGGGTRSVAGEIFDVDEYGVWVKF